MAQQLEGMPRNASTHAAGVVITDKPVSEYVPLAKNGDSMVTQYTMTTLGGARPLENGLFGPAKPLGHPRRGGNDPHRSRLDFPLEEISHLDDPKVYRHAVHWRAMRTGYSSLNPAGMRSVIMQLRPESAWRT